MKDRRNTKRLNIKTFSTLVYNKFNINYNFLIVCGFQLGGNSQRSFLRNSSVVYAKKNSNFIVKISLTSLQLKKITQVMARYARRKSTLYFVHSHFGLKLLMKQLFKKTSMFYLIKKKYKLLKKNIYKLNRVRQFKKLYFVSYWKPGFLTNRFKFFVTRITKNLTVRYPRFGFLNDYKVNLISIKEFKYTKIAYSSMVNITVPKTNQGMFDIPGNGLSYDTYFLI